MKLTAPRYCSAFLAVVMFGAVPVHAASAQAQHQNHGHEHGHGHAHDRGVRSHGSHEHGVGTLNMALEGKEVEIELVSPGHDLVGFEHAPRSNEEKAKVAKAIAGLRDGNRLFVFPAAAGCRMAESAVETSMAAKEGGAQGHGHGHSHEPGHKEAPEGETHAAFHVHYHFQCEAPAKVTHVDVGLFQRFPGIRKLNVQVASPSGQSAHALDPNAARLPF